MSSIEHQLVPGKDIDFSEIRDLFDPTLWDIGYLDESGFSRASASPVKIKFHLSGYDATNNIYSHTFNGIVLAKHIETTNDYSFYREAEEILSKKFDSSNFVLTYTNFKEAALLSGIGSRAKNSLIYNRKFGFQCKMCTFMFTSNILNPPDTKPSTDILDLCVGCDDCINNCPAKAIHEDWIDAKACDNHIANDMKWFWYEKMRPDVPVSVVESWKDWASTPELLWGQGVDGFYEKKGYQLYKDGVPTSIPHCKQCTLQPKCSKVPCLAE